MRKYGIVLSLVVLSVAVCSSSAGAISGPQTFSLLEVSTPDGDQPLGDFAFDRPPAGGDRIAFTNVLYKWAGTKRGARIGRDQVMITFLSGFGPDFSKKATALFTAQVFLQGGSIFVEGYAQIDPNAPLKATLPVLGGTGAYANVGGFLKVRDIGDGNQGKTNLEFHLTA